jgi:hypothetical protein
MLWEGRKAGSFVEFKVECSSRTFQQIRVMYLTGHAINYGFGRIEINGQHVSTPSGFRLKQGSLFANGDYPFPKKCGRWGCPVERHVVRVTVLTPAEGRPIPTVGKQGVGTGFGINSIMCIDPLV